MNGVEFKKLLKDNGWSNYPWSDYEWTLRLAVREGKFKSVKVLAETKTNFHHKD